MDIQYLHDGNHISGCSLAQTFMGFKRLNTTHAFYAYYLYLGEQTGINLSN